MPNYRSTYRNLENAFDEVKKARLKLRGSKEYKAADEKLEEVKDAFDVLKSKGEDYQPTAGELESLQKRLQDGIDLVDSYLDTKKDLEIEDMSLNTLNRVEAMEKAKDKLTSALEGIEKDIEEHEKEKKSPDPKDIVKDGDKIILEMEDAKVGVRLGSKAYNKAAEAYGNVLDKWEELNKQMEGRDPLDNIPDASQIQQMKAEIQEAQRLNGEYLAAKDDKEELSEKTEKRVTAMQRASEHLDAQMKRIEEWEKARENALAEKEIPESKAVAERAEKAYNAIEASNKITYFPSKESNKIEELAEELKDEWKKISDKTKKDPNYEMNAAEADRIEKLNNELGENVDKYIRNKAGKELDDDEKRRLALMGRMKNFSADTKGYLAHRKKDLEQNYAEKSDKQLDADAKESTKEIKKATKSVWFGSKEYKEAMKSYAKSHKKWDSLTKDKPEDYKPTDEELSETKAELENTKKDIQKYLKRNKDKDLSKHPKTAARVKAMEKAYENVNSKLDKVNKAIDKREKEKDKQNEKEISERNTKRKEELKNAKGVDKNMGKATEAAEKRLGKLAQKTEFTAKDIKDARMAMAAKILEARLNAPGGEKFKEQIPATRKGYEKAVKQIADSKAFKQVMPDSKLTPETCNKMIKDPKAADKLMWSFNSKLIENKKSKEEIQKQQEKKMEKKQEPKAPAMNAPA